MLIFETPGLIPLEAFTTFGLNAKPGVKSPIGFFGTGLKYAVAITLRLGGSMFVYRGHDLYEFYLHKGDFRGKEFDFVRMRKKTALGKWGRSSKLPFTLELGKNWEAWMAVRELESNTRDENGSSTSHHLDPGGATGCTRIVIDCEEMEEACSEGEIFLPEDLTPIDTTYDYADVYDEKTRFIYMNGIRVFTADRDCEFTYNITTPMELTEDRTPKYTFMMQDHCLRALQGMTKEAPLEKLFRADEKTAWETKLDFDEITSPSPVYIASLSNAVAGGYAFSRAETYHEAWSTPPEVSTECEVRLSVQDWISIVQTRTVTVEQVAAILDILEEAGIDMDNPPDQGPTLETSDKIPF